LSEELLEMLRKIILGGQNGAESADRAGLDFAIHAGLEHVKAEDGGKRRHRDFQP
jgi:hypothetical protein